MKEQEKKTYVRPTMVSTVVGLESPICAGSYLEAQSPHGENGIESHKVNTGFETANDFANSTDGWDLGS